MEVIIRSANIWDVAAGNVVEKVTIFLRSVLPPFSGTRSKLSRQQASSVQNETARCL